MEMLPPLFALLIPLLPLLAGLVCRGRQPETAGRFAMDAAVVAFGLSVLLLLFGQRGTHEVVVVDTVSLVMVMLVTFLGAVVLRFSRRYLAGDPDQSRFFSWMSLTLASVLTVVLAGHLVLLLAGWVSTSLCLHRLLLHRPERPGAVFSARKKFVFSRMGDLCLLAAVLILGLGHGTWTLQGVFASVGAGERGGLTAVGLLLAVCAMLKSAQFPFHTWLPDTMETPTPVSAFMHAGIVNAGGFLIVRFAPIYEETSAGLYLLVGVGTLSAAFGAIVMLAQPSVKRSLAYSTIAQMGFMLLQCGLGAYGLALIHIVAHSLYKAHAFLTAGSTIGVVPRMSIPLRLPALSIGVLFGGLMVSGGATALHVLLPSLGSQSVVFQVVLALALAYGIARTFSSVGSGMALCLKALGMALVVTTLTYLLHAAAGLMSIAGTVGDTPIGLVAVVVLVFVALFLFQAMHWRAHQYPLGRALYVHALNGFYLGTVANRLLGKLWPRHPIT